MMSAFMLIISIVVLICGSFGIAVLVSRHAHEYQARVFKERAVEESRYRWLSDMGLYETCLYFDPYGVRILSIWGPGIQMLRL